MNFKQSHIFGSFAVDDAQKAREFYGKTLGLDVSDVPEMPELIEIRGPGDTSIMAYAKGRDHTPASFTVLNIPVTDIARAMSELKARGVKFEVYNDDTMKTDQDGLMKNARHGMAIAWFKDPAGNIVSIIENEQSRKRAA